MSLLGQRIARAAQSFIGVPFLLHGRNPATGLDCVGLVAASLRQAGMTVSAPQGYALRNVSIEHFLRCAGLSGLEEICAATQTGDIMLHQVSPAQYHLLVACEARRFVHAHAGLRRVVELPGPLAWPLVKHWRVSPHLKDEFEWQL